MMETPEIRVFEKIDSQLPLLKLYLRLDNDFTDDDTLLTQCLSAAREYFKNAGIAASGADLYQTAMLSLAAHYYEHREAIAYYRSEIPLGVRSMINQLKLIGGVVF